MFLFFPFYPHIIISCKFVLFLCHLPFDFPPSSISFLIFLFTLQQTILFSFPKLYRVKYITWSLIHICLYENSYSFWYILNFCEFTPVCLWKPGLSKLWHPDWCRGSCVRVMTLFLDIQINNISNLAGVALSVSCNSLYSLGHNSTLFTDTLFSSTLPHNLHLHLSRPHPLAVKEFPPNFHNF